VNHLEADELFAELVKEHPDAEFIDDKLMWSPSYGASFFVGISWYDVEQTELAIQILYVFPPVYHLKKDRKVEKLLSKINSQILRPRGFELISDDGATGLLTGLSRILSPEISTMTKFKAFEAELSIVTLATWLALTGIKGNKKFGSA